MKQQSLKALKYRNDMFQLIDFNTIPSFEQWTLDDPEQNEFYLVYRIGHVLDFGRWTWKPHYTIRKYHNGSFGSKDVKYWIKLSEVCKRSENMCSTCNYKNYEEVKKIGPKDKIITYLKGDNPNLNIECDIEGKNFKIGSFTIYRCPTCGRKLF